MRLLDQRSKELPEMLSLLKFMTSIRRKLIDTEQNKEPAQDGETRCARLRACEAVVPQGRPKAAAAMQTGDTEKKSGWRMKLKWALCFIASIVLVAVLVLMLARSLSGARPRSTKPHDLSNLTRIGLALRIYSSEHDECFPSDLGVLLDQGYLEDGSALVSPKSKTTRPATGTDVRTGKCDYLYFGAGQTEDTCGGATPIVSTPPGLIPTGHVYVLYGDGHGKGFAEPPPELLRSWGIKD